MSDILTEGLQKLELPQEIIACVAEKMERYIKEIILFNSAYNLTNTSDHDELVIRHILDSLSGYKIIKDIINQSSGNKSLDNFLIGDIGSGGGLPGIPLAAAFPDVKFQLVERMEKRCAFLENCAAILSLKNVEVVNSQAEGVPAESFDIITFRAFRPLDKKMTKTLLNITKTNGFLCAYKAKLQSINEEMDGIANLVSKADYKICPLMVPGLEDSERNMVVIKKG